MMAPFYPSRFGTRSRLRLKVCSQGRGTTVPPHSRGLRACTFDPFFTTKPPAIGTGLGLGLNNPLTGILSNAELLLAEMQRQQLVLPQQARSRLETIASLD